jgi:hypothetical protein
MSDVLPASKLASAINNTDNAFLISEAVFARSLI